jgi:hypothetical protein
VSEHLFPWSGEQAGHRGPREALIEVKAHARGWVSRARRELARGGVAPSSEAGVSWYSGYPSSETEVRPRGAEAGGLRGR